jgi:hypothetical protein
MKQNIADPWTRDRLPARNRAPIATGIHHDSRGQDQPVDKGRARQKTSGKEANDAAARQPPSPGQPAGGE